MSRYIDADLLLEDVHTIIQKRYEDETTESVVYADQIENAPTVDAVPVVHGKWVFNENDDMFYCTNCKNGSVRNDYPYCHWCGAKMETGR